MQLRNPEVLYGLWENGTYCIDVKSLFKCTVESKLLLAYIVLARFEMVHSSRLRENSF